MLVSIKLVLALLAVASVMQSHAQAKTFNRCQLSRELLKYNFPRHLISQWVCVIENGSGRMTDKVTNHNNAFSSYGLFQISNKDWCKKGRKGGHCMTKCEELVNEDLVDDIRCAKRIYDRVGFKAWPVSYAYCKQKSLPDLSRC